MARVNVMAVLLLLAMSFVTSDAHTLSYPSSIAAGVDTSSGEDVSTVDVQSTAVGENGTTIDDDLSTVDVQSTTVDGEDVKSTAVDDNGLTTDDLSTVEVKSTVTDESILTTHNVITSTVDVQSTEIAGTGSTTDGGSGEVISTAYIKSTQNGETSLATDGEPNEDTSTVDAQMSETAGNGQTTDSQDGSSSDVVVTSQDESTAVAGITTVITEQMTTSSVTVTTPVVTTPMVPSTTTTLPPNHQPPNFDAAPPFLMTFDIGFDKVWDKSFSSENCQLNDECVIFISVVNREINKAFENCPGYKSNSAMVLSFRQGSESQITQQRMQSSIYLEQNPAVDATSTSNENSTYATYNTSFDNEQILINSALVLNYIDIVAVPYLQTADFDGVGVLNESLTNMTIAATSQMSQFTENACPAIGPFVCSTCFPCTPDNGSASTISCLRSCGENEICTVTASDTIGCTCKANYLPVAGDCVDQNIIIGVSAGVGGAILLALIIALICVACKLDKKDKDYDHLLKTQEYRPTPYTVAKVHDTERGDDYTVIDGVRHSAATDDGNEIELRSFHNVIETDSASVAAAAVAVHASQHPALDADSHQSNESIAVRSGHVKQELKPDYDNPSLHSVAAVKEPSSSSHQLPNQKSNEHYRSLYYPQPSDDDSSKEEDPYAGFVPRLAGVDTQNEYIIARPKYGLQPTTNFKDINSQFF